MQPHSLACMFKSKLASRAGNSGNSVLHYQGGVVSQRCPHQVNDMRRLHTRRDAQAHKLAAQPLLDGARLSRDVCCRRVGHDAAVALQQLLRRLAVAACGLLHNQLEFVGLQGQGGRVAGEGSSDTLRSTSCLRRLTDRSLPSSHMAAHKGPVALCSTSSSALAPHGTSPWGTA